MRFGISMASRWSNSTSGRSTKACRTTPSRRPTRPPGLAAEPSSRGAANSPGAPTDGALLSRAGAGTAGGSRRSRTGRRRTGSRGTRRRGRCRSAGREWTRPGAPAQGWVSSGCRRLRRPAGRRILSLGSNRSQACLPAGRDARYPSGSCLLRHPAVLALAARGRGPGLRSHPLGKYRAADLRLERVHLSIICPTLSSFVSGIPSDKYKAARE